MAAVRVLPGHSGALARADREPATARWDWSFLLVALAFADGGALVLAVAAAGLLRLEMDAFLPVVALGLPERHLLVSILVVPVLLLLLRLQGLYDLDSILVGSREYARIAHAATYGVLVVLVASYLLGDGPLVSRSWLLLVWVLTIASIALERFAARRVVRRLRARGALRKRVMVVGASSLGLAIAGQVQGARAEGLDLVGFLDEYLPLGEQLLAGVSVVGRPADLARGASTAWADEFILVPQALPHERLEEITRLMVSSGGPTLRMAVSPSVLLTHGVLVTERAGLPLVTLQRARIAGVDALLKRALDVAGATFGLIALGLPALVVFARAWWLGRPMHLAEQRVRGAHGEMTRFWLLPHEVCAWAPLRGAPALLSVLVGHLSLVGPRPLTAGQSAFASAELDLTAAPPGLTGPWRLSGPSATLAEQLVRDLAYVRDYTIWEDLRILWLSLRTFLRPERPAVRLGRWGLEALRDAT